ncbi:hypothetical protein B0H13DRAFT_1850351 [Mycena leptocephala]|nr:hypothetical protein B0H13DRAFT_1850351 [Mycena leptocephala]
MNNTLASSSAAPHSGNFLLAVLSGFDNPLFVRIDSRDARQALHTSYNFYKNPMSTFTIQLLALIVGAGDAAVPSLAQFEGTEMTYCYISAVRDEDIEMEDCMFAPQDEDTEMEDCVPARELTVYIVASLETETFQRYKARLPARSEPGGARDRLRTVCLPRQLAFSAIDV